MTDRFLLDTSDGPLEIRVGDVWRYGTNILPGSGLYQYCLVLKEGVLREDMPPTHSTLLVPVLDMRKNTKEHWHFQNHKGSAEMWKLISRVDDDNG